MPETGETPAAREDPEPRAGAGAIASGLLVALLVGGCGRFGSLPVVGLAVVSGITFGSLAFRSRREGRPTSPDGFAAVLQIAFLAILCAASWDNRDAGSGIPSPGAVGWTGLLLIAGGLLLRQRAVTALGRHFTVKIRVAPDQRVVDSGPYRWIRHPNYAGLALIAFGTAMVLRSPMAAAITALVWLPAIVVRTRQEEALLRRELGTDYERYASRTWRLVPGAF